MPNMKTFLVSGVLTAILFLPGTSQVEAQRRGSAKPPAAAAKTVAGKPIKVLLRFTEGLPFSGRLNGPQTTVVIFTVQVAVAEVSRPSFKASTHLTSGGRMVVETDSIVDREKQTWKLDPQDFDFVVNWRRDWNVVGSNSPFSINNYLCKPERLHVSSSESWTIEKTVSTVKSTWEIPSYTLAGPLQYPDSIACMGKFPVPATQAFIARQVQSVIIPARGPVLKKVRAFINANTPNKE
jgi:hypothetical protein